MNSRKKLLGALIATTFVAAAPVQASTLAVADLFISTLGIGQFVGEQFVPLGGVLTVSSETRTGNSTSSFNGASGTGSTPSNLSSFTTGATVDVGNQCAGDCAGATALYGGNRENYTGPALSGPGTVNFALADMKIGGSALGGAVEGLTRANAMTSGPTNSGNGNATIGNSVAISADFTVGTTFTGQVLVGGIYALKTYVDSILPSTGSAFAGLNWSLTISSEDEDFTTLTFSPSAINRSFTSNGFAGNDNFGGAFTFFSDARTFEEGVTYNLSITQASNASVNEVPEPASLALVGLGLLGLAGARRRKSV